MATVILDPKSQEIEDVFSFPEIEVKRSPVDTLYFELSSEFVGKQTQGINDVHLYETIVRLIEMKRKLKDLRTGGGYPQLM